MTRSLATVAFSVWLLACGSKGPSAAEIAAIAEPRMETFDEFDSWARRASLGDSAFRNDRAFTEAAFSPIRNDRDIVNAWIVREGLSPRTVSLRGADEPPLALHWMSLAQTTRPHVQAALGSFAGAGGLVREAIVVSRSEAIDDGANVRVIVAFAREATSE